MEIRSYAGTALTVGLIGLIAIMLFGQLIGQPLGLGFVVTGSMSPELEPGDGFVAVPPFLAGEVEQGDVVTFNAEELQGGGLTTHRVVGETSQGYITRGDANPFTDQDAGEPPVRDSEIVAVALQSDGSVVAIPALGTAVMGLQGVFGAFAGFLTAIPGLAVFTQGGVGSLMIGIGLFVLMLSFVGDVFVGKRRGDRSRSTSRENVLNPLLLLVVIILLITVPATASMVIPSGTNELQVISSTAPSDDPTVIETGGSQLVTYNGTNQGFIPSILIIEPASEGVFVSDSVLELTRGRESVSNVTITVPEETGAYVRVISERHYVKVLPTPVIRSLHDIHPWVAIIGIDLLLAGFVTIIYAISIGFKPVRLRSTDRDISLIDQLKRYLP
jgi:signal peptidase